jgi:integrase
MKLTKLRTIELQDFFNSFSPRLASKTIRNMHDCLRALLNQGKAWELVRANPAQGVRLPRKKARKPPIVLAKQDIRRVIEGLREPTKSIVTLMVVGSLRVGEIAALRWKRIHPDRIEIVERFYEGEFDDTKTDAGHRRLRSIRTESCEACWTRRGSGQNIEIRATWFSRTQKAVR